MTKHQVKVLEKEFPPEVLMNGILSKSLVGKLASELDVSEKRIKVSENNIVAKSYTAHCIIYDGMQLYKSKTILVLF